MSKAILVTSLKGGVGKTTVSAGIACGLSMTGARVLAVDMDFVSGGLDVALGCENLVAVPITDYLSGDAPCEDIANPTSFHGLFFAASPMLRRSFFELDGDGGAAKVRRILCEIKTGFDYTVFDMPAGGGELFDALASSPLFDMILVVATDSVNSIRSAEKTAYELAALSRRPVKLVINGYDLVSHKNNTSGIVELISRTGIPVIGVVPYTQFAEKALSEGKPLTAVKNNPAGIALANISKRIAGLRVPLLDGIVKKRRRKSFY